MFKKMLSKAVSAAVVKMFGEKSQKYEHSKVLQNCSGQDFLLSWSTFRYDGTAYRNNPDGTVTPIPNMEIEARGKDINGTPFVMSQVTDKNGKYSFDLPYGSEVSVSPIASVNMVVSTRKMQEAVVD